jgi:succinate dehydrogenase/fumarate reductase-like Fe-S protein
MANKSITVRVSRSDPTSDGPDGYREYNVPLVDGMSAMDALDYIYQNLDNTLAYYDHAACALGICARCMGLINGKPGLLCQTLIHEDITLDPLPKRQVIKDLVTARDTKP